LSRRKKIPDKNQKTSKTKFGEYDRGERAVSPEMVTLALGRAVKKKKGYEPLGRDR